MKTIKKWEGQGTENIILKYDIQSVDNLTCLKKVDSKKRGNVIVEYDKPDKIDYTIAVSCGFLTGLLDSFWVGEFSLSASQEWGREKTNAFVIKVAKHRGCTSNDLKSAIRFLEKDAPIVSDQMTNIWGGGKQHHFRDFTHHASITGLIFSLLTQFTGFSFGTNKAGAFEIHELSNKELIGKNFEEKIFNGIVLWVLHLISDMAGSSSNPGKGTGIPGPILSLAKELSCLPGIRNLGISYNDSAISLSQFLQKIFDGTIYSNSDSEELKRFDLRTEIGIYAAGVKQSTPIIINQSIIRAFYFVRRLCWEINKNGIKNISFIRCVPQNNKCVRRMLTISSGIFCTVDFTDATIRTLINGPKSKGEFATQLILKTNFIGVANFIITLKNDVMQNYVSCIDNIQNKDIEEIPSVLEYLTIDVFVDDESLYDYAFESIKKSVDEAYNDSFNFFNAYDDENSIFKTMDDRVMLLSIFDQLVRRPIILKTEDLFMNLLAFNGIDFYKLDERIKYSYYVPFFRIENGKKIAYMFTMRLEEVDCWERILKDANVDGIKAISLAEYKGSRDLYSLRINDYKKNSKGNVEYLQIKDFYKLISEADYSVYKRYVNRLNKKIQKEIIDAPIDFNAHRGLIIEPKEKPKLTYARFRKWLDLLLGGDLFFSALCIHFSIKSSGKDKWTLDLIAVDEYVEKGLPKPENVRYPFFDDNLIWYIDDGNREEIEKTIIKYLERYVEKGKYANKLKLFKMVSCGYLYDMNMLDI